MNWEFLKIHREGRNRQDSTAQSGNDRQAAQSGDVRLLKPFDSRALGTAREAVRGNLDEFEATLQTVSRLPEQFRLVMAPIENAVNTMALLRNRLEIAEENLASEQRRAGNLLTDSARLEAELDRLTAALKSEESNASALREKNSAVETALAQFRQDNAELLAKVNRLEPQLRELTALRDTHENELADLRRAKAQADDLIVGYKAELTAAADEIANRDNLHATLQLAHTKNQERLDEATKSIAELEAALKQTEDKFSFASAALVRERNAARALRTENEQLYKERDETKNQFESQIEAAKARYDFVEKMLTEARARFHEETRQLSVARRERAERDREIGRLTLALEAAQRDATELRSQIAAANESVAATSQLLASEIEQRRKLELEIDMIRSENSTLLLKQKTLSDSARSIEATVADATQKFQAKVSQLSAENEQLRAAVNAMQNRGEKTYDDEFAFLFDRKEEGGAADPKDGGDDNIIPLR
ncbi:MAG: hypothetical protein O9322_00305 [Beijerinckiaceae bacterium]|nr:hypothetical protein [Beijerinckiaceae bacterium]MCZ8301708.1 hypothetical protein [Beijerinckiaceae bacterium]